MIDTDRIAGNVIYALKSTPMAFALLLVNVGFLIVGVYVLGQVAENAGERNKSQMDLISKLVTECRQIKQQSFSEAVDALRRTP